VLQASVAKWEQHGRIRHAFPFKVDGQNWWAGFEWIEDHPEHAGFWTGILVPESDFLGALSLQRNFFLAAIVGFGLLLGLILTVNAVRKIRSEVKEAVSHIGRKLGPFELLYKIGDGGNGTVYRANHALLKRPTAVKVMLPQYARSEAAKQRFQNEVQITSSLTHPNTVAVFDFGQTPEGTLYYAMEHLDGVTLEDLVRISGPQPSARVLHILHQICGSLREAHSKGLIHRDIKPANIMLCERGGLYDVVKVLDFGLVKDIQQEAPQFTQADAIVGTPFYLAPELITDASVFSPLSDLYALGGVAYYLLTGRNVFEGASAVEICAMHLHDEPVPPSKRKTREISPDLEAIVMSCLAKQAVNRPQGAETMSEMLIQCRDFGAWTRQLAQQWWTENRATLPMEEHHKTHSPLANTHLLLDAEGRTRT
jgi:serine/threonine protein kinase